MVENNRVFNMIKKNKKSMQVDNKNIANYKDYLQVLAELKHKVQSTQGFAFIGRQYHLVVSGNDYYIDLLFYNLKLRCYVVIELKARKFDPRDTGQLNFYLSVVDDQLKHKEDNPTIGILLCKTKDDIIAEYALRGVNRPIGVARYETDIINQLPKELKSSLPTIEEIEAELEKYEAIDRKSDPKSHLR